MSDHDEPERLHYFAVTGVQFGTRGSIREPMDPRVHLDLLSTTAPPAELSLGYVDALHLIERLSQELARRAHRADIHRALNRTEPGDPTNE